MTPSRKTSPGPSFCFMESERGRACVVVLRPKVLLADSGILAAQLLFREWLLCHGSQTEKLK